jgi:hypothetical protein
MPCAGDRPGSGVHQRSATHPFAGFQLVPEAKMTILDYTPALWEYQKIMGNVEKETSLKVFMTWEISVQESDLLMTDGKMLSTSSLFLRSSTRQRSTRASSGAISRKHTCPLIGCEYSNLRALWRIGNQIATLILSPSCFDCHCCRALKIVSTAQASRFLYTLLLQIGCSCV